MKNCPGEVEPGHVGEGSKAANCSPPIAPLGPDQQPVDPRAGILLRAAVRDDLLRAGEIDLDFGVRLSVRLRFLGGDGRLPVPRRHQSAFRSCSPP